MQNFQIYFRYFKQNLYTYSALSPLFENIQITNDIKNGIMIYSFFSSQKKKVYAEITEYKNKMQSQKNTYFIAGGPHPTGDPVETINYFDFVVIGEGEKTLTELVSYIINQRNKNDILYEFELQKIDGIIFKNKFGNIIETNKRKYINLNKFPCFNIEGPYRPIEITRGCLYSCKYCQTPVIFGHKLRHRSVSEIVKYSKYYKDLRFISPNSFSYGSYNKNINIEKINTLLKEIKSCYENKNIYFGTFPSEVRPEYINEHVLQLIHKFCKNNSINIGAQSGSNIILKEISRSNTVEDIYRGIQVCFENDIVPIVDFIFGFPTETINDLMETISLMKWICKYGGKIRSHYFSPLPGTKYYHLKPKKIPDFIQKELGKLALAGSLKGKWDVSLTSDDC